ncbi:MAG: protein-disulfide reductase DsbD family protein [Hyphomicrobiaceae bacterium]
MTGTVGSRVNLRACALLVGLAVLSAWATHARADATWTASSEWVQGTGSRIRLIGAELKENGTSRLLAGIEIELESGWKTYWRSPGDAGGIPPVFDWDQSRNIAKAVLSYPAPQRFVDPEGISVGYKTHVVFPIEVTGEGNATPELMVGAFYGICRELCIPAEAELKLTLGPTDSVEPAIPAAIEAALAAVPRRLAEGALPMVQGIAMTSETELLIDALFDPGAEKAALFVEAEDGSYVTVPQPVGTIQDGLARFRIEMKPEEIGALKGKPLVVTLVSDKGNAEVVRKAE